MTDDQLYEVAMMFDHVRPVPELCLSRMCFASLGICGIVALLRLSHRRFGLRVGIVLGLRLVAIDIAVVRILTSTTWTTLLPLVQRACTLSSSAVDPPRPDPAGRPPLPPFFTASNLTGFSSIGISTSAAAKASAAGPTSGCPSSHQLVAVAEPSSKTMVLSCAFRARR